MLEYDHYGYPSSRSDCRLYVDEETFLELERVKNMDINEAFPSKFLKAEDLRGQEVTLKISGCIVEQMGDGDHKPCLSFVGKEKQLVLNKTNSMTIVTNLQSSNTDEWIGKSIKIYPTQVDFAGRQVAAIRVRLEPPDVQAPAAGAEDDIPF